MFLQHLKANGNSKYYEVNEANKKHEIWQRDSLAIEIYSREVAKQKIDYIHFNPVTGKWQLAKDDLDYYFSSARFYETGIDLSIRRLYFIRTDNAFTNLNKN